MQLTNTTTDDSLMELAEHGTNSFPFQYYHEDIKKFDIGYIDWHWHREFEFVSIESGEVVCIIGTTRIMLQQGDSIFINAGILHRFEAPQKGVIPNVLFSPEFIAPEHSFIYKKYIRTFSESAVSHLIFHSSVPWQKAFSEQLYEIYRICPIKKEGWELEIHSLITRLWLLLYEHRNDCVASEQSGLSLSVQNRLKYMTVYIEENYSAKLSLEDIAKAASISKSEALRCFKTGFQTSPIEYLISFRLKKARSLLISTRRSISDIAYSVGIENISYFNRRFKKEFGNTPKEMRKLESYRNL